MGGMRGDALSAAHSHSGPPGHDPRHHLTASGGATLPEAEPHLFRQYFEDLQVGDTVTTHKHTVTEADIVNFANVSGDNFYAHMDAPLEGTLFEQRVAHGYFVLSKAAGLFVDPKKARSLNYGIDEARFTKPVYPGATLGVRLTVKEKIAQERRRKRTYPRALSNSSLMCTTRPAKPLLWPPS